MRMSRFSDKQIIDVIREEESGAKIRGVCDRDGIAENTFRHWRTKYGRSPVGEARRPHQLEDENRRLKRLVAESALDLAILKDLAGRSS